jgi:hypothetical protein
MFIDALTGFVQPGAPLSLVAGAGVAVQSDTYDILGVGVGNAPPSIIGTATTFGADMGVGGLQPELVVTIGTALVTANSATLNVQLQAAPDTAVTFQPGTWQTIMESGALTAAQCTAGTRVFRTKFPPTFPANQRPRYYRLNFVMPASENFTAGTIANAIITVVRDDYSIGLIQPRNYTVS